MSKRRVRLVQLAVTPTAVIDDGKTLTPISIQAFAVLASEIEKFPALLGEALAALQAKIDKESA